MQSPRPLPDRARARVATPGPLNAMTDATAASASSMPYLHGFSPTEQARLPRQARIAESTIFRNVDYAGARRLLAVGSGVGAQTEILLRRFPDLHATCID